MYSYNALKNAAGIALFSDYLSLRQANEIIHDVNERSPLIRDKDGFFLGLAYDLRNLRRSAVDREGGPRLP